MSRRVRTGRRLAAIAVTGCALVCTGAIASPAGAQALTQEVAVRLGGEVATNPYLDESDSGVTVAGTAEVRPRLSFDNSVTRFDLEAYAQGRAYADKYDFEDNYGVAASVSQRMSDRLSLSLNGSVDSTVAQGGQGWWSGIGGGVEGPTFPQVPGDVTVLGRRGRTTSIAGSARADYSIDAYNQISVNGGYRTMSLTQLGASEYSVANVGAQYNRVISERTSVGLVAGYRLFDYKDSALADARSLSLLGSISLVLAEAWTLEASAGVERTRNEQTLLSPAFTHTGFTASASLCRRDSRESICLDYSRQSEPTSFAGIRTSDLLGLAYSRQLTPYDSFTLGANYSRSGGGLGTGPGNIPPTTLAGVRGGLDHRFSQRLSGYVEASLDRLRRRDISIDPRARLGVGIRYLFGRIG